MCECLHVMIFDTHFYRSWHRPRGLDPSLLFCECIDGQRSYYLDKSLTQETLSRVLDISLL